MKFLTKIVDRIRGRRTLSDDQMAILTVDEGLKTLQTHLIALARLSFVNPERLVEEADNAKANAEYLLKMIEGKEKGKTK